MKLITLLIGLVVVIAIIAAIAASWALLSKYWVILVGIAILTGIAWLIQCVLAFIGLDIPLWILCISLLGLVMYLGYYIHQEEQKIYQDTTASIIDFFDNKWMGGMDEIRLHLEQASIKYKDEWLKEIIEELIKQGKIKVAIPNQLWQSTKPTPATNTIHIEI